MAIIPVAMLRALCTAFFLLSCASSSLVAQSELPWTLPAGITVEEVDAAVERLREGVPGLQIRTDLRGRTILSGEPMVVADDPDGAVELWWELHGDTLGAKASDRELVEIGELSGSRGSVRSYRLHRGPVRVEGGIARLLVRETPDGFAVIHAAGIAALSASDLPIVRVDADRAGRLARAAFASFTPADRTRPLPAELGWDRAELVIRPGTLDGESAESVLAWHVVVHEEGGNDPGAWTVRVDPGDGRILEIRDERLHVDVEGSVQLLVSPPPFPDIPNNPPDFVNQPRIRVSIPGGASVFTEEDGSFVLPNPGTGTVDVVVDLVGPYATVVHASGTNYVLTTPVLPPTAGLLSLGIAGGETVRSQMNAFHFTDKTHHFYRSYNPTAASGIDTSIEVRANVADVCNATFDPSLQRINLYLSGGGCVNTAFSNVIAHEYGHFIVNRLNLAQGAFGEGFGDVVAMLLDDDPIIGRAFAGPGSFVRDPVAANVQYPCSPTGGVHFCGQILGGCWWGIRTNLGAALGDPDGLELARQLFVDWSALTIGGIGTSSAHPDTAIEVLVLADDDGSIANGVPNFAEICAAFAVHSVSCPTFPPISISFPAGRPDSASTTDPTEIQVVITPGTSDPIAGTARLLLQELGSTTVTESPLVALGGDLYLATIPPQPCGGEVLYRFAVDHTGGSTLFSPSATTWFNADAWDLEIVADEDTIESPAGWVAGSPGDTATTGQWEWGEPLGTGAAPGDDHTPSGTNCFFTQNGTIGGSLGEADVDGGFTTLTSPGLDASGSGEVTIHYWRWYSNNTGAGPNEDVFQVEISSDGGLTWVPLETVGPAGPGTSGGWIEASFLVADFVTPTSDVRLRFTASDLGTGSLVEAAIDDLRIERRECLADEDILRGDVDGSGLLDLADVVTVLGYLFEGVAIGCVDAADADDSGGMDISDAITPLLHLFGGGSPLPAPFPTCGADPTTDALGCVTPTCP